MITDIEIRNFLSIQQASIHLEPLTVIVGANATGKSNLIKALEFISDVSENGIQEAVYKRGGFEELLPKHFKNLNSLEIYFKLNFVLKPPIRWRPELGNLKACYELGISRNTTGKLKINRESLSVNSILLLSFILNKKASDNYDPPLQEFYDSQIIISRNKTGSLNYSLNFSLSDDLKPILLDWLGIKRLFQTTPDRPKTIKNIEIIISSLLNNVKPGLKNKEIPVISSNRVVFGFSPHLREIIKELTSISRYDLFINELRQEQPISNSSEVSNSGDNIPSVVKRFIKQEKNDWKRILRTMSNISPYFLTVHAKSLRAGKEYLVFQEIFKGRPVECWEASDGTLRALAILLSIESHSTGSIILIEEPEHGLHPWAVKDLMNHIKETIETKSIQVIITTHSQQVLESINPKDLLITERNETGTSYTTIRDILPDSNISMGEIGELWTRGLLKGIPLSI